MSNRRKTSTPRIVEVPDDSDEVLDWGSSDEIAEVARSPGAIKVDNYYSEEDDRDGTGGGDSGHCSKDIVFRFWIVGVMSIRLRRPLSFWRVFGPTFFGAPVYFWGPGVATVEYVTQFGFIDAMVVVLGPA